MRRREEVPQSFDWPRLRHTLCGCIGACRASDCCVTTPARRRPRGISLSGAGVGPCHGCRHSRRLIRGSGLALAAAAFKKPHRFLRFQEAAALGRGLGIRLAPGLHPRAALPRRWHTALAELVFWAAFPGVGVVAHTRQSLAVLKERRATVRVYRLPGGSSTSPLMATCSGYCVKCIPSVRPIPGRPAPRPALLLGKRVTQSCVLPVSSSGCPPTSPRGRRPRRYGLVSIPCGVERFPASGG